MSRIVENGRGERVQTRVVIVGLTWQKFQQIEEIDSFSENIRLDRKYKIN